MNARNKLEKEWVESMLLVYIVYFSVSSLCAPFEPLLTQVRHMPVGAKATAAAVAAPFVCNLGTQSASW